MAVPLRASALVDLNFEGLQDTEAVLNYYDGGAGSLGSGPGANRGVTFSADATAFIQSNQSSGNVTDTGGFGGESSSYTAMLFCGECQSTDDVATIDVSGGLNGVPVPLPQCVSIALPAPAVTQTVQHLLFSLDGTGSLLGTLTSPAPTAATADATGDGNCDEYGNASNPGAPFWPIRFTSPRISTEPRGSSIVFAGSLLYDGFLTTSAFLTLAERSPGTFHVAAVRTGIPWGCALPKAVPRQ